MSRNTVIAVVVIVVVMLLGWSMLRSKPTPQTEVAQPTQAPASTQSASPSAASEGAMMKGETRVKITSSGFSPKSITIKAGEKVSWANNDSAGHTVNSSPHPTHTDYPFLNLGLIKPGESKSVTFDTAGTYKYHDHLNPSLTGAITVE